MLFNLLLLGSTDLLFALISGLHRNARQHSLKLLRKLNLVSVQEMCSLLVLMIEGIGFGGVDKLPNLTNSVCNLCSFVCLSCN